MAKLRVQVDDTDLLRVQVAPDSTFTDPASADPTDASAPDADIVVKRDYAGGASSVTDTGAAYVISTTRARLTVTKSPITLRLQDASGAELMRATAPLAWNASGMTQTLAQLKLTAKHSGLSLAVDGTGKVLQVTDTGAATQRWTATANEPAPGRPRFEVMRAWKRARDDLERGLVMQR